MDDNIRDRIKSLLTKASDSAASEAEAASCMAMAQKLMKKYDVTEADLDRDDSVYVWDTVTGKRNRKGTAFHPIDRMMGAAIGRFCGVVKYFEKIPSTGDLVIQYYGRDVDVEYAQFMRESFKKQADREWEMFKVARGRRMATLAGDRNEFYKNWVLKMKHRLEGWTFGDDTQNALVVKKNEVAISKLGEQGIHLGAGGFGAGMKSGSAAAAAAGAAAGGRADIGRATSKPSSLLLGSN